VSRFNSLSLGDAMEAAELLGEDVTAPTTEELVAALINALRRIYQLENQAARLQRQITQLQTRGDE
jgi:hypothetical protein